VNSRSSLKLLVKKKNKIKIIRRSGNASGQRYNSSVHSPQLV